MLKGPLRSRRLVLLVAGVAAMLALACTDEIEIPAEKIVEVIKEVPVDQMHQFRLPRRRGTGQTQRIKLQL